MYPKSSPISVNDRREREKMQRREQLKDLIIKKFQSKYSIGVSDSAERNRLITKEVTHFIENEKCTQKNLISLDKKLLDKFGKGGPYETKNKTEKRSRHGSVASKVSSNVGSHMSNRSTIARAGLNISNNQGRDMSNSAYHKMRENLNSSFRHSNLNKSQISPKVDEWDHIIINDVRQYEEEQKNIAQKRKEMKRKIMDDLNAQMHEKRQLQKRENELEKELEKKRLRVYEIQDKRRKQQELQKSRKNEEEKLNREFQIAEIEKYKRLEKEREKAQAITDKKKIEEYLQAEMDREKKKREDYQLV